MPTLLSIIIPVYNRQAGLERLLNSLLNTLDFEEKKSLLEVIIVDDCSSTPVIVPPLPFNSSHVRNQRNLGAPRSRKRGFQLSQGQYVHFHDSDDTFSSTWLSQIISILGEENDTDLLLTARNDISNDTLNFRFQRYFHRHHSQIKKIRSRLVYRNCLGPLGGVVFSRKILHHVNFKPLASSQDWQMYLDAIGHCKKIISRPDITYNFHIDGSDRISHNSARKILGFLQLSHSTRHMSRFNDKIRLFYLFTCRHHIKARRGLILKFYKKKRFTIFFYFAAITIYWRLT